MLWLFFAKERISWRNSLAIKKLRSTPLSTPKLKKKGIEKQFEANSQDLDHVESASSFLAATPPQVQEALEELREAFQNPYTVSWPISSPGLRGRSWFACGTFAIHFRSQCPVLNYQPSANRPNKRVWWPVSPPKPCRTEISLDTVFSNIII